MAEFDRTTPAPRQAQDTVRRAARAHRLEEADGRPAPGPRLDALHVMLNHAPQIHDVAQLGAVLNGGRAAAQLTRVAGMLQRCGRPPLHPAVSRPVVQRAGVRAELREAEANYADYMDETNTIDDMRSRFANDIYNAYKPSGTAGQSFHDKTGRAGVNPAFNNQIALIKAKRLNHWTKNATNAATRIYAELIGAAEQAENTGFDLSVLTMGQDTRIEPDVFINDTTALESKRVDSPAQGSVDEHITKGSAQLEKRKTNPTAQNKKLTAWVAYIQIDNEANPWPFTPAALHKLIRTGQPINVAATARSRITKYKKKVKTTITYVIASKNPSIGSFQVVV